MAIMDMFNNAISWIKNFWDNLDLQKLSENIGGTSSEAVLAAIYFGLSFAIGILLKKYLKFLFGCVVCSIILIKVMEYNTLVTINWADFATVFGFGQEVNFNSISNQFFDWIKNNVLLFISSTVGFLIGYKLG